MKRACCSRPPDLPLAEWLVEEGIGEERAIFVDSGLVDAGRLNSGEVIAACAHWPGQLTAGMVASAQLVSRHAGSSRGTARFAGGEEALVEKLPRNIAEGASLMLEVTRPALAEHRRGKLARARPTNAMACPAPGLAASLGARGYAARIVHRFPAGLWDDVVADAFAAAMAFPGGSIVLSPTPAMTLIDVDGTLPPAALALAAVPAIAQAIGRLDLAGSIGIDFPTLTDKADRRAVDAALTAALDHWPHEQTAMNGFGFVQLVAQLSRPSLLHKAQFERAAMAARLLLRRAEHLEGTGTAIELAAHPAVLAALRPQWREDLARRTGRKVVERGDPALALEAPHAQFVTP